MLKGTLKVISDHFIRMVSRLTEKMVIEILVGIFIASLVEIDHLVFFPVLHTGMRYI